MRERCAILGIEYERGLFLVSCAKDDEGVCGQGSVSDRGQTIPYDPLVLLREAIRLGLSFRDTAKMMKMKEDVLRSYGLTFPRHSAYYPPPGRLGVHNLFLPDPLLNKPYEHPSD